jgi:sugar phosphate isomerase/epimerase
MAKNRRQFIKTTASATTALMLSSLDVLANNDIPSIPVKKGFELMVLATGWGFQGSLDLLCSKVKKEGYDGMEMWWPMDSKGREELFSALKKYDLQVGFLCGASQPDFKENLAYFKKMAEAAASNAVPKPVYINCHSGKDFFSVEENTAFIQYTSELSGNTGIPIFHETHRSRILYSAPMSRMYMEKNPQLKITLDASHWCTVSESLLQDQQETMKLAVSRTEHIHARVGHAEGPQVNDPRAPEWEAAVNAHLSWWDAVIERKKKSGERITILTEFGPPDYMPTMPYTRQPLSDQWAINVHMMQLLRKRYLTA